MTTIFNEYHEGPIIAAIQSWLGGDYEYVTEEEYLTFFEEDAKQKEELYELPRGFDIEYKIDNDYSSKTFCWGWFGFGTYKDQRFVVEQNASPFLIYRKTGLNRFRLIVSINHSTFKF